MTKFINERIEIDNIIRLSVYKSLIEPIYSVVIRAQPKTYNKYNCIKIKHTKNIEKQVKEICKLFWHCGLPFTKKVKLKEGFKAKDVFIEDAREIVLEKIHALDFDNNTPFDKWWKETEYKEEELDDGEKVETDNIIRMSGKKEINSYFLPLIKRIQPFDDYGRPLYNKYKCIRVRFTMDLEFKAKYLCGLFWNLGLVPLKKIKLKHGLPVSGGYIISDAREVVLVKIGAIEEEDEAFEKKWKDDKYKEEG